jgi:hypothetical protein
MSNTSPDPILEKIFRSLKANSASFERAKRREPYINLLKRIGRVLGLLAHSKPSSQR